MDVTMDELPISVHVERSLALLFLFLVLQFFNKVFLLGVNIPKEWFNDRENDSANSRPAPERSSFRRGFNPPKAQETHPPEANPV
jgi:hypothetical protein